MAMIGKIRRMRLRQNKSIRAIAKATGLSRNTVRKWLRAESSVEPKYRRASVSRKLKHFEESLRGALSADVRRPKRERRSAKALFGELKKVGYQGGYSRLTDFIRQWRASQGHAARINAYVPLSFEPGEAFQFDWSEEGAVLGGFYRRIQLAHMKLCSSRAFFVVAYPSQGHEMLFDAHTRGFAALGGVARRGIYDNMKTAVDQVKKGKGRVVNARFAAMCAHYLFEADFCNVAAGWEKGRVEKNVQDSRRRLWIEASSQRFSSFEELNAWLATRCRALWSEIGHPEQSSFNVAQMLEIEQAHLMPIQRPFDGYVERMARVSSTSLVVGARNRYSVPCEFAGQIVSVRLYPNRVTVVVDNTVVADHHRLVDEGQVRYDWQHYIPLIQRKPGALRNGAPFADLPEPLQQLRRALLREPGGDRIMAKVLALVPQAGLEAVLVAVGLALEQAPPSGRVSIEHVVNVLGRLNAAPLPANIQTALQLETPVMADTARYDRLRPHDDAQEIDHV